jgi:hypothetical protein
MALTRCMLDKQGYMHARNSYPLPRLKATEANIRVFEAQWYILMQLGLQSESVRSEQATAV